LQPRIPFSTVKAALSMTNAHRKRRRMRGSIMAYKKLFVGQSDVPPFRVGRIEWRHVFPEPIAARNNVRRSILLNHFSKRPPIPQTARGSEPFAIQASLPERSYRTAQTRKILPRLSPTARPDLEFSNPSPGRSALLNRRKVPLLTLLAAP
jgi:hypothetical protein